MIEVKCYNLTKVIKVEVNMIITVKKQTEVDSLNKAVLLANAGDTIIIESGIYYEKVKITKSNLKIIGQDPNNTIITFDDYALKIHSDGLGFNTFRTYTMMILANNVHLENLQIVNSSGSGKIVGQAVALSTIGNNISINNCKLTAHQDTLFLGPLPIDLIERYQNFLPNDELIDINNARVLIENTTITGDVDFIFGCANALFKNCIIHSLESDGYVAAPSTSKNQEFGLTFVNCKFTSSNQTPHSYLARPWRDYGKAVFINCIYDNHIYEDGFNKWNDTERDKTCRFYEYKCSYLNNKTFKRIYFAKKLNDEDYLNYTKLNI
jgi:pectinesterase